jgi:hypothetical protein
MGKAKRENWALGRENWASGQVPREWNLRFGQRTLLTSCAFLFFLSFVGGDLTPAFSASAHKGLSGCLVGRVQRSSSGLLIGWRFAGVQVKEMGGHTSGGAMRENGKRDNCNAVKMSASEFSDDLNGGDRRSRGARATGREARVEEARQRLEIRRRRWEAQRLGGTAMAGTATASIHMTREEVDEKVCAGGAKTSSDMKVRALLSKLEREQIVSERRNIISALQHSAPQDHPLAIDALCAILSNYKREPIGTRKVVLGALQQVATRGNELVVTTLLTCVKRDNCFEVRQPAMALLASLANYRDTRAMDMALEHLRKKDLRGEPLFKPYGERLVRTSKTPLIFHPKLSPTQTRKGEWGRQLHRHTTMHMPSYDYICVLILRYMCLHTAIYLSSYCCRRPHGADQGSHPRPRERGA